MPAGLDDHPEGQDQPRRARPARRLRRDPNRAPLVERLKEAFLKPADPDARPSAATAIPETREELEAANRSANDQERLLGVVAAPLAALVSVLVGGNEISRAIPADVSIYESLLGVLVVLSVVMLACGLARKRLYLGIVMALFGLAVFNLHFWGFGIPFLLGGSWLLVRAYRLQRALKDLDAGSGPRGGAGPRASRRYTPPTSRSRPRGGRPRSGR